MAYIDTSKITIPKGFFEDLNTPKLLDWLNSQPTADVVEVRHGEWITESKNGSEEVCRCSVCNKAISFFGFYKAKYCDCGAKMDGGKNETL